MKPFAFPRYVDVEAERDPRLARAFETFLRVVARGWFRFRLRGVENVPSAPSILVGNHSGIGIADIVCLLGSRTAIAPHRKTVGLAHDLFVNLPVIGRLLRAAGAVTANPESAREALRRGHHVAVFPGGGYDACRPITRAREVSFGRRRGYVRLALETGALVVPIATVGSHPTYVLLPWIGEVLGERLKRWELWRDERIPVPLATLGVVAVLVACAAGELPWWSVVVALTFLLVPNPWPVESVILEPIDLRSATEHVADPDARIEVANAIVEERLRAVLTK